MTNGPNKGEALQKISFARLSLEREPTRRPGRVLVERILDPSTRDRSGVASSLPTYKYGSGIVNRGSVLG